MSSNLPAKKLEIPEGLAYHLALNRATANGLHLWDEEEICADHGITIDQLAEIRRDPEFTKQFLSSLKDVKESGDNVRLKARHQFEHYLDTYIPQLFMAEDNFAEKNKALVFLGKVAQLTDETAKSTDAAIAQNNVPQLRIILTQAAPIQQPQEKVVNVIDNEAS